MEKPLFNNELLLVNGGRNGRLDFPDSGICTCCEKEGSGNLGNGSFQPLIFHRWRKSLLSWTVTFASEGIARVKTRTVGREGREDRLSPERDAARREKP